MKSRFNNAFSLLEVLITVAILSTAIIFIFRSFTALFSSARFSQNITLACYLTEDKLWEIESTYPSSIKLPEVGLQIIQNRDFNWNYEILDTDNPDLKELKFTVFWKENIREKEYPMEFITYLPASK